MRLKTFQIRRFRNIVDSGEVSVEPDVTCLVGKNESGKTAVLHALERLLPAREGKEFSIRDHYPAWLEKADRLAGQDLDAVEPVTASFELEDDDLVRLAERFGPDTLLSDLIVIQRTYDGRLTLDFEFDEKAAIEHAMRGLKLPKDEGRTPVGSLEDVEQLAQRLEQAETEQEVSKELRKRLQEMLGSALTIDAAIVDAVMEAAPEFFYFGDYSRLPGIVRIQELLTKPPNTLSEGERTALALLRMAASDDEYLVNADYQVRKRELENVANALTIEVLSYWSQNPELRAYIDITQRVEQGEGGATVALDELHIRTYDNRHLLSLPFGEHSSGFRWFFSFLAAFSEFERRRGRVVILLDEPALGLHARAQSDFLRFIEERLAPRHQVVYTTHSPFMVQADHLERVRMVEDRGRDQGAMVSTEVLASDPDTLFPIQGAIGYQMARRLFAGQHNLVVEGTSDFTYLVVLSDYLKSKGMSHLDDRWTVVPTGGAEYVPTFVAMLGQQPGMTVLIDAHRGGHQHLTALSERGFLPQRRIVTVGRVLGRSEADVEDLFDVEDYLALYNGAFGESLSSAELEGNGRILSRIEENLDADGIDLARPADHLLRNRETLLPTFTKTTLDQFAKLFDKLNATLRG